MYNTYSTFEFWEGSDRSVKRETGLASAARWLAWLNNNQLKILALITMTADHVGLQLLPQYEILRILGRLAFPIFAYMIAEGCHYTRNRRRYLLTLACMAACYQIVYFVAMGSLYQGIFVTFTLSASLIFAIDLARAQKTVGVWCLPIGVLLLIVLSSVVIPELWTTSDFAVDYGIFGILLPAAVYFAPRKGWKLLAAAVCLIGLGLMWGGTQWFALFALLPLACYNGQRGKMKMKNLFYIYYPAHLVVIYLLDMLL